MAEFEVKHVAAFVRDDAGGNPAGVVTDAAGIDAAMRQQLASLAGFSETAFVDASRDADFRIHFYTPTRQIAHCGHATVATFAVLAADGRLHGPRLRIETLDGTQQVALDGRRVFLEQRPPVLTAVPAEILADVAASLRIDAAVWSDAPAVPEVVDTGNRYLILPFSDGAALADLRPRLDAVAALSERLGLIGYYAFAPAGDGYAASTRMFAPAYGIDEEAATGTAAACLAGFLAQRCGRREDELVIEQGVLMKPPSPSRLIARLERRGPSIERIWVGGEARERERRRIEL